MSDLEEYYNTVISQGYPPRFKDLSERERLCVESSYGYTLFRFNTEWQKMKQTIKTALNWRSEK